MSIDIVRQVRKGTLQAAGVSTGAMSVVVPEIDIFELPYLFDSVEQAISSLDAVRPLVAENSSRQSVASYQWPGEWLPLFRLQEAHSHAG